MPSFSTTARLACSTNGPDVLSRWIRLVRRHHPLLFTTLRLLILVRLTLTFSSYRPVLRWIEEEAGETGRAVPPPVHVWAVSNCAKIVPFASCLTQALTLRWLFARAGIDSQIRIGVAENASEEFRAHAWLMREGQVEIGGTAASLEQYTQIAEL